jgi:hypothetical protein
MMEKNMAQIAIDDDLYVEIKRVCRMYGFFERSVIHEAIRLNLKRLLIRSNEITLLKIAKEIIELVDYEEIEMVVDHFIRENPTLSNVPRPLSNNPLELALAASIIEWLAMQKWQNPPAWATEVAGVKMPYFLGCDEFTDQNILDELHEQSPEPLRKRNLFALRSFLRM